MSETTIFGKFSMGKSGRCAAVVARPGERGGVVVIRLGAARPVRRRSKHRAKPPLNAGRPAARCGWSDRRKCMHPWRVRDKRLGNTRKRGDGGARVFSCDYRGELPPCKHRIVTRLTLTARLRMLRLWMVWRPKKHPRASVPSRKHSIRARQGCKRGFPTEHLPGVTQGNRPPKGEKYLSGEKPADAGQRGTQPRQQPTEGQRQRQQQQRQPHRQRRSHLHRSIEAGCSRARLR